MQRKLSHDVIVADRGFRILVRCVSKKWAEKPERKREGESFQADLLKRYDNSENIICRGRQWTAKAQKKVSYQRWQKQLQANEEISFRSGRIERSSANPPEVVETEDSDEDQTPYHWSKTCVPGSHPVARALAFDRRRRGVPSTAAGSADSMVVDRGYVGVPVPLDDDEDDLNVEKTVVLTGPHFKAAMAQDGAEAAGLETTGSAAGQRASSAPVTCSDPNPIFSGTVVPATRVDFAAQVTNLQHRVGVTEPLVSNTSARLIRTSSWRPISLSVILVLENVHGIGLVTLDLVIASERSGVKAKRLKPLQS
jgi:hypothetical protein